MKVITAEKMGFCMGVRRAVEMVEKAASVDSSPVWTLGDLVHNHQVVEHLEKLGVRVQHRGIPKMSNAKDEAGGKVVIAAYGSTKEVDTEIREKGFKVLDATCPFVKVVQIKAREYADYGFQVLILGDKGHTEVAGVVSWSGGRAKVISAVEELEEIKFDKKIALLSQTTQSRSKFQEVARRLLDLAIHSSQEIRICNTICNATEERQRAVVELQRKVDLVLVVGGKGSANTKRLAEISGRYHPTYHIETAQEIKPEWFKGVKEVGLTAGASTPDWIIEDVKKYLRKSAPGVRKGSSKWKKY